MDTDTQIEAHDLGIYRREEAPRITLALEDPLSELRELRRRVLDL